MNRAELVEAIAAKTETSKVDTERLLGAFLEEVTTALARGEEVKLVGFGSFKAARRAARVGKNPQTGAAVAIPARSVPVFKPGRELKDKVAGGPKES